VQLRWAPRLFLLRGHHWPVPFPHLHIFILSFFYLSFTYFCPLTPFFFHLYFCPFRPIFQIFPAKGFGWQALCYVKFSPINDMQTYCLYLKNCRDFDFFLIGAKFLPATYSAHCTQSICAFFPFLLLFQTRFKPKSNWRGKNHFLK
jgi:hypothetical protein